MKIEPQDYLQKLVEVYQAQCNQLFTRENFITSSIRFSPKRIRENRD